MTSRAMRVLLAGGLAATLAFGAMGCGAKNKDAAEQDAISFSSTRIDESGLQVRVFDLNMDRTPDVYKYYKKVQNPETGEMENVMVKRELDLNHDGKIDMVSLYDDDGQLKTESYDLDFDGRVDLMDHYANGQIMKKSIDFAFDERPDMFKYYLRDQLVRVEKDRTGNGKIDWWEYYKDGQIERIGVDLDGDGQVDTWQNKAEEPQAAPQGETDVAPPPATVPTEEGAEKLPEEDVDEKAGEMRDQAEAADAKTEDAPAE